MNKHMPIQQVARFALGRVLATPGALQAIDRSGEGALPLLARHQSGDWGEVDAADWQANEQAIVHGWRLLSAYVVGDARVWVITEADRSATTLLLPEEY